jgi:hypothetical protein
MTINEQRPYTWTSADAAGLPVFVGLARYDEVAAGAINHALRFTLPSSQKAFVLPATHWASTNTSTNAPPMGLRLRLKASFDISALRLTLRSSRAAFVPPATHWASNSTSALAAPMGMRLRLKAGFNISSFSAQNQVILTAMKKYGMILADNGSAIFISGAPDNRWNNTNLNRLKQITASSFEVVQTGTIYTPANVPTGPNPTISSFTANPTSISAGQPVTLSWSVSNSTYNIIDPTAGPVRGTSIVVNPAATTTYTLYTTNQFGRTTATVTVTVH